MRRAFHSVANPARAAEYFSRLADREANAISSSLSEVQENQLGVEVAITSVNLPRKYLIRNVHVPAYTFHTIAVNLNVIGHLPFDSFSYNPGRTLVKYCDPGLMLNFEFFYNRLNQIVVDCLGITMSELVALFLHFGQVGPDVSVPEIL